MSKKQKNIEERVLASVLYASDLEVSKGLAVDLVARVTEEHFNNSDTRKVFVAIKKAVDNNCDTDAGAIFGFLDGDETVGAFVANLSMIASSKSIDSYISSLKLFKMARDIEKVTLDVNSRLKTKEVSKELLNEVIGDINKIIMLDGNSVSDEGYLSDYLGEYFTELQDMLTSDKGSGIMTGIKRLDYITGGFKAGELITVAGRTGMGKSSLLSTFITHQILGGTKAVVFSMEMGRKEITDKIFSMTSSILGDGGIEVPFRAINNPNPAFGGASLTSRQLQRLQDIAVKLKETSLYLRGSSRITIEEIMAKTRKLHSEGKCDILYIDHIGLLVHDKDKERQELTHITNSLKLFASELQIPIVIVVQMNRGADFVDGKPKKSHLKGSGSIEEDSSVIIFPWRPSAIDTTLDPKEAEIILAKGRNSGEGSIPAEFSTYTTLFTSKEEFDDGSKMF
jgi:replicative DNA helicase